MNDDLQATADQLIAAQRADGAIAREPGGTLDPWTHTEAAMGLDASGRSVAATRAYAWLARTQNADGSWCVRYRGSHPVDRAEGPAGSAHVAVGVLHHYLCGGDASLLAESWPMIDRAMAFVLAVQRPTGEFPWRREPTGATSELAFLAGNCDIHQSIRCALTIASLLGHSRPQWMIAARSLRHVIVQHPEVFAAKPTAVDWYYPALTGVLSEADARRRLDRDWHRFVGSNNGVRRFAETASTTAAETAELALTLAVLGDAVLGADLLGGWRRLRHRNASEWAGHDYETGRFRPPRHAESAEGVVLLAAAAIAGHLPTLRIFGYQSTY